MLEQANGKVHSDIIYVCFDLNMPLPIRHLHALHACKLHVENTDEDIRNTILKKILRFLESIN